MKVTRGELKKIINEELFIVTEAKKEEHLLEQEEMRRLAEDLDREYQKLDELFGFGKSREDKWKAIAAGEDEEEPAEEEPAAGQEPEEEGKRGFFGKMADYAKGVKDISGFFGKGAGTLLAGEETFDMEKRTQLKDTAKAEIEKWLSNLNYPPLKTIYQKLISDQFPNNDKGDFNGEIGLVEKAYGTIVDDHQKGQIDTKHANLIIAVMRGMVIYFQDFAIADRYMYIKEEEGQGEEGEEEETMGATQGAMAKNTASAYSAKLPLALAAAGAAALGAGFVADSQWFQDFILSMKDMKDVIDVETITTNATETLDLGEVQPGEGVIKVIRRLVPGKENFAKGAAGSDLGFLKDPKHKMVYKLLKKAMGAEPGTDVGAFETLVNSDGNAFETFISGPMSGKGGTMFAINKGEFQGQFNKILTKQVERVKKMPAKTVKNWFIKTAGEFLGPVLKSLGIGLIAGAGVSAAMRAKGKRSSRMAQLTSLVDSMLDVTDKGETQPGPPQPGGDSLEQSAGDWVAAGKPGHEDPSFMDGKSVSSSNLVTRGSDNFLKDNPGDPNDTLKPDALELAKAQLAWLKTNPGRNAAQRNGRASMADDLKLRIQATEKDPDAAAGEKKEPATATAGAEAGEKKEPATAQGTPGFIDRVKTAARAGKAAYDGYGAATTPTQGTTPTSAATTPEWDPKHGSQPAKKDGESDEEYGARLKRAAWAAKSRLSEIKRFQELAGILKG
jgi:hypothetical protein